MKQAMLALVLVAVPVAAFAGFQAYLLPPSPSHSSAAASLGDLSSLEAIVADVQVIANTGDLAAAEKRITDFETAWDDAESSMRPKNPATWGAVDDAADAAIHALRSQTPDAVLVKKAVSTLLAVLDNPSGTNARTDGLMLVSGIPVTDAEGHAIACEEMLNTLRELINSRKMAQTDMAAASDLQSKAIERCNADDDIHADEFVAQGLALASH